jgi:hypothetical protein
LAGNSTPELNEWVAAHNERRQKYHTEYSADYVPVQWDDNLAADAQVYADFLISEYGSNDADTCFSNFYDHGSDEDRYGGENLLASYGAKRTQDEVVERWAGEEEAMKIGRQFTQVIWRATKWIGCGVASKNGCFYYVCRYVAPGNCNINSTNAIEKAMADTSPCGPLLPE